MSYVEDACAMSRKLDELLPSLWRKTYSDMVMNAFLTNSGVDALHEIARRYMDRCIAVNDREGIKNAQQLLVLAIERRTPEQVAAIEEARGLLH
jgi:hypothetical protein